MEIVHEYTVFSKSSLSQVYFELASISDNESSNFLGFTVYEYLRSNSPVGTDLPNNRSSTCYGFTVYEYLRSNSPVRTDLPNNRSSTCL